MQKVTEAEARAYLTEFDPPPTDFVNMHLPRYAATLNLLPEGTGKLLELGCDNHFTLLLEQFTHYEVRTQNLPEAGTGYSGITKFTHKPTGRQIEFQRDLSTLSKAHIPTLTIHSMSSSARRSSSTCCTTHGDVDGDSPHCETERRAGSHDAEHYFLARVVEGLRGITPYEGSYFWRQHKPPMLQHAKEFMPHEVKLMLDGAGFSVEKFHTPHVFFKHERYKLADLLLLALIHLWFPLTGRHPRQLRIAERIFSS